MKLNKFSVKYLNNKRFANIMQAGTINKISNEDLTTVRL